MLLCLAVTIILIIRTCLIRMYWGLHGLGLMEAVLGLHVILQCMLM